MLPIHNILHPTDFSDHSEAAFRLAYGLARDYNANLTVLHVVHEPVILVGDAMMPPPMEERWEVLHEKLLALQPPGGNVRVFHRLEEGNPAGEILRVAKLIGADLIVMGTHGRRGLRRILMGSVAEYVLERSSCPVLTSRLPVPLDEPAPDLTVANCAGAVIS